MQKYKAIIEYVGTNYCGMQKQKDCNIKSIQGVVEDAISKFANTKIEIDYSGRTDSGVHAIGQVIHFILPEERDEYKVLNGINFYLVEEEVVVKKVEKVDSDFHARFSAKMRRYLYKVLNAKTYSPLLKGRVYHYAYDVDVDKMQRIANALCGKKMDFSSFCSTESINNVNPMKTINKIKIERIGDEIHFYYEAKSFLHNMIRILTGVLLEAGRGRIDIEDVWRILEQKRRPDKCETVPACGLYFLETLY